MPNLNLVQANSEMEYFANKTSGETFWDMNKHK